VEQSVLDTVETTAEKLIRFQ